MLFEDDLAGAVEDARTDHDGLQVLLLQAQHHLLHVLEALELLQRHARLEVALAQLLVDDLLLLDHDLLDLLLELRLLLLLLRLVRVVLQVLVVLLVVRLLLSRIFE